MAVTRWEDDASVWHGPDYGSEVLRYHPQDRATFGRLAGQWRATNACEWVGELGVARAAADHPLNARLAVEGLLISYIRSIREPS